MTGPLTINADSNDVTGLTVPIVQADKTEDEARNNPRAQHAEMAKPSLRTIWIRLREYIVELTRGDSMARSSPTWLTLTD